MRACVQAWKCRVPKREWSSGLSSMVVSGAPSLLNAVMALMSAHEALRQQIRAQYSASQRTCKEEVGILGVVHETHKELKVRPLRLGLCEPVISNRCICKHGARGEAYRIIQVDVFTLRGAMGSDDLDACIERAAIVPVLVRRTENDQQIGCIRAEFQRIAKRLVEATGVDRVLLAHVTEQHHVQFVHLCIVRNTLLCTARQVSLPPPSVYFELLVRARERTHRGRHPCPASWAAT